MAVEDLRQSPMMGHMLDALENGEDIGHYGRLVFAMIGRHFVDNEELVALLTQDHDAGEQEMKALVQQVEEKGYSPPKRDKILEYQAQQDFPICPNPDDPDACNPYQELQFPDEVYELDFSHLSQTGWCRSPPIPSKGGHLQAATHPALSDLGDEARSGPKGLIRGF